MRWFISCLLGLFFGLSIMLGLLSGYLYLLLDDVIAESNRTSLLKHYNIVEE